MPRMSSVELFAATRRDSRAGMPGRAPQTAATAKRIYDRLIDVHGMHASVPPEAKVGAQALVPRERTCDWVKKGLPLRLIPGGGSGSGWPRAVRTRTTSWR